MTDLENIRKALGNAIDYLKGNNLQLVGEELQTELVNAQKQVENLAIPDVVGRSEQLQAVEDLKDLCYDVCPLDRRDDLSEIVARL